MHDVDDDSVKGVLGEALMDDLKAIREYVQDVPEIKKDVAEIKDRLTTLEVDMKVVKAAVTDQSEHLSKHDIILNALKRKSA